MHLLVDGLCMCCLFLLATAAGYDNIVHALITYNILAFLTQPITGMLADRMPHRYWLLMASNVLLLLAVAMAVILTSNSYLSVIGLMTTATLLGIGNSLFHVWGGKQMSAATGNDIRALGVFVSTGAFGLALGMLLCSWLTLFCFLLAIHLLSTVLLHYGQQADCQSSGATSQPFHWLMTRALMFGLMAFVMLRSLTGESFTKGIPRTDAIVLTIGIVAMAGKMAGGWIARGMGIVPSLAAMLAATLICYMSKEMGLGVQLTGLFAINCTMPVTLYLANVVLRGREGLAFGLLAAALIPGYLLAIT